MEKLREQIVAKAVEEIKLAAQDAALTKSRLDADKKQAAIDGDSNSLALGLDPATRDFIQAQLSEEVSNIDSPHKI